MSSVGINAGPARPPLVKTYHKRIKRTGLYQKSNTFLRYVTSYYRSRANGELFRDVETYGMFIGHGVSGHSLIGALLDAHPQMVIPDEVDALKYVAAGFSRDQLYRILFDTAGRQAARGRLKPGRRGKPYSYAVSGQWQGRAERVRVIGDSKAGVSMKRLAHDPALLPRLRDVVGVPVKFIHITRNPYDNISSICLKLGLDLRVKAENYFTFCEYLRDFRRLVPAADLLHVRHEDFINQPAVYLEKMCHFLGVEARPDYLDACAAVVYKSPIKSRSEIQWSPQLIELVNNRIAEFDFLQGYSYEA